MTRAEAARVALRLADALGCIGDELRREDVSAAIIDGDRVCVLELCGKLCDVRGSFDFPSPGPGALRNIVASNVNMGADTYEAWSDTWRAWGAGMEATPIGKRCLAVAPDAQGGRCPSCGRPRATDDARRAYVARTDIHAQRVCHG